MPWLEWVLQSQFDEFYVNAACASQPFLRRTCLHKAYKMMGRYQGQLLPLQGTQRTNQRTAALP